MEGSEETPGSPQEKQEAGGKTALLPLTMFSGDVKPGDTITMRVTGVYGDEVGAELVNAEPSTAPEMSADNEIDMMAKENE